LTLTIAGEVVEGLAVAAAGAAPVGEDAVAPFVNPCPDGST
jgi:hypothetical protein